MRGEWETSLAIRPTWPSEDGGDKELRAHAGPGPGEAEPGGAALPSVRQFGGARAGEFPMTSLQTGDPFVNCAKTNYF